MAGQLRANSSQADKIAKFNVALQKTGDGNRTNTTDQNNSLCLLFSSIGVKWSQLYVAESGGSRRWTTQILSKGFLSVTIASATVIV
jgi:hypothetical protein